MKDVGVQIEELIGNTPLLRLARVADGLAAGVRIYAKAEWCNPGGSVKDRPALNMIREGVRSGNLTADHTLIDATSGNTGIAYAMLGAAMGCRVKLCVPRNASPERLRIMEAYRADLVLTDPGEGTDGAIREARRIVAADPDAYFYPDQYENEANWRSHYETTANEVWEQTDGTVTHFVAALGTSGTMMGTGRRLRELNAEIELISVQPDSPFHGLEGMKHMPSALVPGIYDDNLCDRNLEIGTEAAQAMIMDLSAKEGVLVGPSSGAACVAALQVAETLDSACIVTVFPDNATKYLSEGFWGEH
jgi:cysteine synthase B